LAAIQIARSNTRVHHRVTFFAILGSESIYDILVGVAGNQAFDWATLDSEIKTAGHKNVSGDASFAALRLLIAQNRISLRSCTTAVLVVEDSADRLMQHRQCVFDV
jgi:hypothetical protein